MRGCVCRSGDGVVCLVGLRGAGPALAGRLWGGKLSRCALGRKGCSPPMLAPTRPRGRPVAGVALRLGPLRMGALVDCAGFTVGR